MHTFTWNGPEFARRVEKGISDGLVNTSIRLQSEMITQLSGPSPSKAGSPPGVDRGTLRRSITYKASPRMAVIGTPLKYGWVQEFGAVGGVIRPRTVKALPVPLNYEAKRMLRTLSINGRQVASLRSRNLTYVPKKDGERVGFLVEKIVKNGKNKGEFRGAVFALRKSIKSRPRPWVRRSYAACKPDLTRIFAASVAKATGIKWEVTT